MNFSGFRPEDFLCFLDDDNFTRVEYIRDSLHPRLRDFGVELAKTLGEVLGVELRAQLRSGRWYKNPWGTWVSLIIPEEQNRSDNRRPRLSVFLDEYGCMVGFMQNVWRARWKQLLKNHHDEFARLIDQSAQGQPRLQLTLLHWTKGPTETWERRISHFKTATELLRAASEWGQDFVCVGQVYPFPQEADLLISSVFGDQVLTVFHRAWPVYRAAFQWTEV